jgi:bifunctional DNA-binding transcriptional regulator/antitoxin component of YhaV-PrlF toxin-antitoxin module
MNPSLLPTQIREDPEFKRSMKLKPKDRVVFTRLSDGTLVVRAKNKSVADLMGILPKPKRKVRVEDMRFGKRACSRTANRHAS